MKKLSKESFEKAKSWIRTNGRQLEKARLENDINKTQAALKRFQNSDGGFGHAIEPDLRAPDSSVLGTSIAFQILRSCSTEQSVLEIALPAVKFLLNSYDSRQMIWRIIPKSAENYPHAPWWNQADREDSFSGFHLNPTAEILGYLFDFKEHVPDKLISSLSSQVMSELKKLKEIEMHDLLCCKRLSESGNLDDSFKQNILKELTRLLDSCVVVDPSKWGGYGLRPLQVVESPASVFYSKLHKSVEENLDYEIDTQDISGAWLPTWTWKGMFPNDWEKAKKEWTGIITFEKLVILRRFQRV